MAIELADNLGYYISKWGGSPGQELFNTPFNTPGADVKYWELNKTRISYLTSLLDTT
jgi:hypothetical protein